MDIFLLAIPDFSGLATAGGVVIMKLLLKYWKLLSNYWKLLLKYCFHNVQLICLLDNATYFKLGWLLAAAFCQLKKLLLNYWKLLWKYWLYIGQLICMLATATYFN